MFKGITLNQLKDRYDIIVIGAGIGGLTCANYLAKAGLSVLVVERHFQPGGYCTSFKRNGYTFDAAAHLFSSSGKFEIMHFCLNEIGARVKFNKFDPIRLEFPNLKIKAFGPIDEFQNELKRHFPGHVKEIDLFFSDFHKIYRSALRNRPDDPLLCDISGVTFAQFLERYFGNHALKKALSFMWLFLGDRPDRASALAMINLMGSYMRDGSYRIAGGAQSLPENLSKVLTDKGGDILLSKEVKKVIIQNGKVDGVVLSNAREISTKCVVSNADAMMTVEKLVGKENFSEEYVQNIKKMSVGEAPFEFYLGINYPLAEDCEGFYFLENEADELIAIVVPTKYEPSLAPAGRHALIVTTVFPYKFGEVKEWRECKREMEEKTLDQLERIMPGIRKSIEVKDSATPKSYYRYTLNQQGSAYGWASTPDQFWKNRLDNKAPIPGLYFVGHWTKPGTGIVSVVASGKLTSALILKEEAYRAVK